MLIYSKNKEGERGSELETGQDLAEYAVFIGLIALVVLVSITLIGTNISEIFTALATAIRNGV
jgi:Flp pilus assembly pilin Flp